MAEDLQEFLRRAAERRQQRAQGQSKSDRQEPPRSTTPVSQQTFSGLSAKPLNESSNRSSANPSFPDRSPHLASEASNADERMDSHLHQVFDNKLGSLGNYKARPNEFATRSPKPDTLHDAFSQSTAAEEKSASEKLIEGFLNPESARIAFVASEVFRRKF